MTIPVTLYVFTVVLLLPISMVRMNGRAIVSALEKRSGKTLSVSQAGTPVVSQITYSQKIFKMRLPKTGTKYYY